MNQSRTRENKNAELVRFDEVDTEFLKLKGKNMLAKSFL